MQNEGPSAREAGAASGGWWESANTSTELSLSENILDERKRESIGGDGDGRRSWRAGALAIATRAGVRAVAGAAGRSIDRL
jgi:hypothetical protein